MAVEKPGWGFGSMLSAASQAYSSVANSIARGRDWVLGNQALGAVMRKFYGTSESEAARILQQGQQAVFAANLSREMPGDRAIPREIIPRDRYLPAGVAYRYSALVSREDLDTGNKEWVTLYLDSKTNLTGDDIREKFIAMAEQQMAKPVDTKGEEKALGPAHTYFDVSLLSVFRRTAL